MGVKKWVLKSCEIETANLGLPQSGVFFSPVQCLEIRKIDKSAQKLIKPVQKLIKPVHFQPNPPTFDYTSTISDHTSQFQVKKVQVLVKTVFLVYKVWLNLNWPRQWRSLLHKPSCLQLQPQSEQKDINWWHRVIARILCSMQPHKMNLFFFITSHVFQF